MEISKLMLSMLVCGSISGCEFGSSSVVPDKAHITANAISIPANEPDATYGSLIDKTLPASGSVEQHIDSPLSLVFDNEPTLGEIGKIRIYDAADDSLLDTLVLGKDNDSIGHATIDKFRNVNYQSISLNGNTLTIKPHNRALAYAKKYYVVITDKVVEGGKLNGSDFVGLGKEGNWSFSTKTSAPTGRDILVDDNGPADFRTLQGAIDYVVGMIDKDTPATITLKDGIYEELLYLRNKNNLTIQGESRANTRVQYNNYESYNPDWRSRAVFLVESADNLVLKNFTLKNTHTRTGSGDQAETLYFNSPYRLIANNMSFISEQDTLLLKGYNWFYNSLVAGNVDFIWGYSNASLFENSEIRTIGDSKYGADVDSPGGYILQARNLNETDAGFVFLNSRFTRGPGPLGNNVLDDSTYIARSSGKSDAFDHVVLINNYMDKHITSVGWAVEGVNNQPAPNPTVATAISGWREYGSMDLDGNVLDLSSRVGGYLLNADEALTYLTRSAVFSSYNNGAGWTPSPLLAAEISIGSINGGFASDNGNMTGAPRQ
ncbi:pectinesterase family protein [Shewanella sp. A14]